ncbi:MAG TPA: hypothetical protein VMT99_01420 [Candidatus Paceibacterota bacterium]|nr:hypothetical protein [Candidatus Paceibacterota bacterium]
MSTASSAVPDGTRMTDEQLGQFTRRCNELKRRISEGTLEYAWVMNGLQRLIEGVNPFRTWKTIKLGGNTQSGMDGTGSGDRLLSILNFCDIDVSDLAEDIVRKMPLARAEAMIPLVLVSGHELGFNAPATQEEIYARARACGLDVVPAEVGPQLRLQYKQRETGWVAIGMQPVESEGYMRILIVGVAEGRVTFLTAVESLNDWSPEVRWVFTNAK